MRRFFFVVSAARLATAVPTAIRLNRSDPFVARLWLDDVLVIWGGEFGRTPKGENRSPAGRDYRLTDFHGKVVKDILV